MPYKKLVGENAEKEFAAFYNAEIQKSKDEIFNDSYEIRFYDEMRTFLTSEGTNMDEMCYRSIAEDGEAAIGLIYYYYLKDEYSSINTWEDIVDMVNAYCKKYHQNIMNGGSELE